ncbi:MAG: hypothetical protein LBT53_03040 [Puniceicoccales bacterium]|jgi:hypothetical protein|nr:hypothetical protein [Puniceicoccales bacterium]
MKKLFMNTLRKTFFAAVSLAALCASLVPLCAQDYHYTSEENLSTFPDGKPFPSEVRAFLLKSENERLRYEYENALARIARKQKELAEIEKPTEKPSTDKKERIKQIKTELTKASISRMEIAQKISTACLAAVEGTAKPKPLPAAPTPVASPTTAPPVRPTTTPPPVPSADSNITVFGKRTGGNNTPQQQPPQQPQQNTSNANSGGSASTASSKDVLVGPHWVHPLGTFIFAKDGSVWEWYGHAGRHWERVRNFGDEVVDVGEPIGQFILSTSKDKITRQAPGNNREYHRKIVSPSRNIAGVVWVRESQENWKITFHANGEFSRQGSWGGRGPWINLGGGFYGVCATEGEGVRTISMYKLNSDFTQLERRWSENGTGNWTRTTSLPPEIPVVSPKNASVSSAAAPVAVKHILSNTKWRFGNADTYMVAFYSDGTYTQKMGVNISTGKWLVTDTATIRFASGNITFTIAPDRQTITQSLNGKSYVWNYAGQPKATATTQSGQVVPPSRIATTSTTSTTRTQVTYPEEKMPVEGAFVELNILFNEAYNNALAERNKKDVEELESFIKKAALKNTQIAQFAQKAIDTVNDNEAFFAVPPVPKRKRLDYEDELWTMKISRDRAIEDVARTIGWKFTGRYEALLKRAASAIKIELVVNIKRKLKYIKLPRSPWNHGHWVGLNNHEIKNGRSFVWRKGDGDTDTCVDQKGIHKGASRWHKIERGENIGIRWIDGDFILSPDGKRMQAGDNWYCIRIN